MSHFQQKIMTHPKKQESVIHTQERKQSIETIYESSDIRYSRWNFKVALINMLKNLNKTIFK